MIGNGSGLTVPSSASTPSRRTRSARFVAVVTVLVVWGLMTHGTFAGSGDEPHYLIVSQSIAFDGDLDLANNYAQPGNLIGGGTLRPEAHARPGVDGVLRPAHDIGLPILFAPIVRIAYPFALMVAERVPATILQRARLNGILVFRHAIGLCMALIAAALALQLLAIFRQSAPELSASGWALLIVLSPPLLSHSFLFFTELPSAFLIIWIFRTLTVRRDAAPRWLVTGLATGALLLIHVRNVGAVAALSAMAAYCLWANRAPAASWSAWLVGAAIPVAGRSYAMHLFWGTWLTSPLAMPGDVSPPAGAALAEVLVRTSGLLFDQEFGLLVYSPLYLLAAAGFWRMRLLRSDGTWAMVVAVCYVAPVVIPHVNIHGWTGGWAPPARMITPIVPLLGLAAFACGRSVAGVGRAVAVCVIAVQLVIDAVVWQWPKSLWNYGDGSSALLESIPALSRALPAWHGPGASAAPFVACLLVWSLLTWVLVTHASGGGERRGPAGRPRGTI